jgi:trans-2,3-dihydro-3-hydroxyanthranilate isomerase
MVLEENIGPVACWAAPAMGQGEASFILPALPQDIGAPPPDAVLAQALGLAAADIGFGTFRPCCWSAGVPYTFVPLSGLDAVGRAAPAASFAATFGGRAAYVFGKATAEPGHDFHARMFAPHLGIAEDPATGSAAAAFAGVLARFAALKDGAHSLSIEQGYEMGRPSVMRLGLTLKGGTLTAGSVGGDAVIVTEGTIEA